MFTIHSQSPLLVYLLVNSTVSDLFVSLYTHPVGSGAPFFGSSLLPKCRGYRTYLCLCALSKADGVVTVTDKSMNGTFVNGKLLGKDLSCKISPKDIVSLAKVIVNIFIDLCLCVHIYPIHSCDSSCVERSETSCVNAHNANRQHESACLIFLSLFLLALLRICRISTHTSSVCEVAQFDRSIQDQGICGDLPIICRLLCTGNLLM